MFYDVLTEAELLAVSPSPALPHHRQLATALNTYTRDIHGEPRGHLVTVTPAKEYVFLVDLDRPMLGLSDR